jgi:hypothetical protein
VTTLLQLQTRSGSCHIWQRGSDIILHSPHLYNHHCRSHSHLSPTSNTRTLFINLLTAGKKDKEGCEAMLFG